MVSNGFCSGDIFPFLGPHFIFFDARHTLNYLLTEKIDSKFFIFINGLITDLRLPKDGPK